MSGRRPSLETADRRARRQFVVGLVALPLSLLPFVAYVTLTPEGRLVRDRVHATLFPPTLPVVELSAASADAVPAYQGSVMALAYHGVGSTSDGDGGFVVPPRRFAEHLATMKAAGFHTVTAAEVADSFSAGTPLPPKAVMITFDDGRADAMLFADRLLAQAGMRATMFVITGAADNPGIYYAGWKRLEAAARSGRWDLQAHTDASHHEQRVAGGRRLPALTSLAPGESRTEYRARVRADLATSSAALEEHVGRRPVAFAYPFGAYGAERTNDPALREILRQEVERQYALAFHQDDQDSVPLAGPGHDRLGLRRLEVENWSGLDLLGHIREAARRSGVVDAPSPPAVVPPSARADLAAPAPAVPGGLPRPELAGVEMPAIVPNLPRLQVPTAPPPGALPPVTGLLPVPGLTSPAFPADGTTTTVPPTTTIPASPPPTTAPPTTTTTLPRPTTTVPPTTSTTVPRTTTTARNCGGQGHGSQCPKA